MDSVSKFLDSTLGKLVAAVILVIAGSASSMAVLEYKYDELDGRVGKVERAVEDNKKDLQSIRLQISEVNAKIDSVNLHLSYQRDSLNELKELLKK